MHLPELNLLLPQSCTVTHLSSFCDSNYNFWLWFPHIIGTQYYYSILLLPHIFDMSYFIILFKFCISMVEEVPWKLWCWFLVSASKFSLIFALFCAFLEPFPEFLELANINPSGECHLEKTKKISNLSCCVSPLNGTVALVTEVCFHALFL